VIADVIAGAGHFLGHEQTLGLMQTEYTYPMVGDRQSPDDWRDAGARSAREAAHEVILTTLANHHRSHIASCVDDVIRSNHTIHLEQR
jgi:trimethylamine--corrinoid protein Co-methyltransferase